MWPYVGKSVNSSQKNERYQVKVGRRRVSAYRILKKEDSRYDKIKAYVVDRDLDDE